MTNTENKPSVGIRAWGTLPKQNRQFDDDLPRLPYMKLKPGINNVRIVSEVGVYYQARWKSPNSKRSFGDRVRTSFPTYGDDCPVKKYLGLEGKERYMVVVIDRSEGDLKLLDLSQLTLQQIETTLEVKNSQRTDGSKVSPTDFDISIKFDPKSKSPTNFYSVVAHDTMPMSKSDLELISDVGGADVIRRVLEKQLICPKPETVIKKLKELGWDGSVQNLKDKDKSEASLEEPAEDDYSFSPPADD